MTKWEYLIVKTDDPSMFSQKIDFVGLQKHISVLGDEGWELVSAMDTNRHEGKTQNVVLYFKRPKV